MPQIRVMMWNIQDFGGASQENYRGVNNQLLASVIGDLVRHYEIDILMIMEVRPTAAPSLAMLVHTLNAGIPGGNGDWKYDWIKGSIDNGSPYPPVSSATLSWRGGAGESPRLEGYALFWRSNQPEKYALVPARNNCSEGSAPGPPGHYLELVTEGLALAVKNRRWWPKNAYNPVSNATRPIDANQAAVAWEELYFPWVSRNYFAYPREFWSRRPAFALLNLNIDAPQADRLLPLIFYHAPSLPPRARLGTICSALSKQINVCNQLDGNGNQTAAPTRVRKAIIGGDFNWKRPDPVYSKFVAPYADNVDGGSELLFDTEEGDRTTVQIRESLNGKPTGAPITADDNDGYYRRTIDQLMYRGLNRVEPSLRVDMLQLLRNQPFSPLRRSMALYHEHFQNMIKDSDWYADPEYGPFVPPGLPAFGLRFTNWNAFYANLRRPDKSRRFTTARSAAEFMNIFVSDHVPLVLTFET